MLVGMARISECTQNPSDAGLAINRKERKAGMTERHGLGESPWGCGWSTVYPAIKKTATPSTVCNVPQRSCLLEKKGTMTPHPRWFATYRLAFRPLISFQNDPVPTYPLLLNSLVAGFVLYHSRSFQCWPWGASTTAGQHPQDGVLPFHGTSIRTRILSP